MGTAELIDFVKALGPIVSAVILGWLNMRRRPNGTDAPTEPAAPVHARITKLETEFVSFRELQVKMHQENLQRIDGMYAISFKILDKMSSNP